MAYWIDQLIVIPVLLPLVVGAVLVLVNERHHRTKLAINSASTVLVLIAALTLAWHADSGHWEGGIGVYLAANWAAPFGISLVADRLSTLMLVLTGVVALGSLAFAASRWSRTGVHFHSLFQLLLMGINGSFLTGDLFNLFVFFEVMLAAAYGLLLHGTTTARVKAGLQFITINLVASFVFLIGIALVYGSVGSLNMADIAARIPLLAPAERQLLEVGAAMLGVAFLTKGAMWPLCFWLPTSYAAASAPVAAMLVVMTKVGFYVILRLWLLAFPEGSGSSALLGSELLFWGGIATLVYGSFGLLASQESGRMGGYSAIVSTGTLLVLLSFAQPALMSGALFYLVSSTLALAALMLLFELTERVRTPSASLLALTMEAFAMEDAPQESAGVAIPAAMAFLGLSFVGCALVLSGMPPLAGFVAKLSFLHALLASASAGTASVAALAVVALVIVSGLAAIIALMRFGVRTFWAASDIRVPRLRFSEAVPIAVLLLACVGMTLQAGPLLEYLDRVAAGVFDGAPYIERVLGQPATPGMVDTGSTP